MWRTKKFKESIVVLGAGFAGIECARRLQRKLGNRDDVHVALVDKNNHSVFQPLLPEVASAAIASHHVVNPVRMLARDVDFDCAEVERIDLAAQKVYFKSPEGMELLPMPYTHLVIAVGLVPNMAVVPGMAAHGLAMQTVGDAYYVRDHVLSCLEMAANTSDAALRRELLTVVTVGAGFSGVETCAEVHDMMTSALRYFPELSGEKIRSVLVSSTPRVLPALSATLGEWAAKSLRSRGVEVLLEARTTSVTPSACFLKDGTKIPTRTVISTIGFSPHPLVLATDVPKDKGRIVVDASMRVKGMSNVWALGDCALVTNAADGQPSPPTAQFAVRQGKQLADNIVRALRGEEPKAFAFKQLGYAASLGHLSAVVEIGPVRLSGFLAWWVWRTIYLMKLPGLLRKVRVMLDWTVALFFPRDITTISAERSERVGREHFEPGQLIVKEGDRGDAFYTVVQGEVEVVRLGGEADDPPHRAQRGAMEAPDDGEKVLARLGPGAYFGEEALLTGKPRSASVRAVTACDLLALGRSDFRALADNLKLLGDTFKKARKPIDDGAHGDDVKRALKRYRVKDRMLPAAELVTIDAGQSVEEACRLFQHHSHDGFPVLANGKLVGVVGRAELYRALSTAGDPARTTCGELCSEALTCHPDDDLAQLEGRFRERDAARLWVVDAADPGKLLGLISETHVLQKRIAIELALRKPDVAQTVALPE
jgi:NADH:ubiquinone reductase (H+-translocating)